MTAAALFAHQGGWDEMLMVAGPILLLWLILNGAKRRAQRVAAAEPTPDAAEPAPDAVTTSE